MTNEKELAYRYDLFVTPDWRDRFDTSVSENVELPSEGVVLDVNCGTGAHAIELAERLGEKGEVIAVDSEPERIELARAKAQVKKLRNITFRVASPIELPFENDRFEMVIGDASMSPGYEIDEILAEMVRVAKPAATVVLKMATHGSFDEFFSVYWEALLDCELVDEVWPQLEELIRERATISDAEEMASASDLTQVTSVTTKEEFQFESASQFFESPLIVDNFMTGWMAIVPEEKRDQVRDRIAEIIDRESAGVPFLISVKATVLSGKKEA